MPSRISQKELEVHDPSTPWLDLPARPIKKGHSWGTWMLIAMFALGGIHSLWQGLVSFTVPANMDADAQAYVAAFGAFDRAMQMVYGILNFVLAWLLLKLRVSTIRVLWGYVFLSTTVALGQLLFSQAARAFWGYMGWWPLLLGYGFWALMFWYLYRLRAEGRLRA